MADRLSALTLAQSSVMEAVHGLNEQDAIWVLTTATANFKRTLMHVRPDKPVKRKAPSTAVSSKKKSVVKTEDDTTNGASSSKKTEDETKNNNDDVSSADDVSDHEE